MIAPGTHTLPDGREAEVVEIAAGALRARVATLGAALLNLWAPDARGHAADVTLGHADLEGYSEDPAYLGVAVGRTAGRIAGARVTVDGTAHALDANDGANALHGGPHGLSWKVWRVESQAPDRVTLAAESPAGEGGYPGRLAARLTYGLAPEASGDAVTLALDWHAEADAPTPVALTHHPYWNLRGHAAGGLGAHLVQSDAARYLALDGLVPSGETPPVDGTALELRRPTPLALAFAEALDAPQEADRPQTSGGPIARAGGLDHDLLVPPLGRRQAPLRRVLRLHNGHADGRARGLDVWTTEPCVHLYDGAHLDVPRAKGGARYGPRAGLAVETQPPPDATRISGSPHVPSVVLRPGEALRSRTEYRFHTQPPEALGG